MEIIEPQIDLKLILDLFFHFFKKKEIEEFQNTKLQEKIWRTTKTEKQKGGSGDICHILIKCQISKSVLEKILTNITKCHKISATKNLIHHFY